MLHSLILFFVQCKHFQRSWVYYESVIRQAKQKKEMLLADLARLGFLSDDGEDTTLGGDARIF